MADGVRFRLTLGATQLLQSKATAADVAGTIKGIPRYEFVRHCTRMLNSLAFDRRLQDDQAELVRWLPAEARLRASRLGESENTDIRLFHPFQQLMLVHAGARFCDIKGGADLSNEEKSRRWALASIQVNDLMTKAEIPERLSPPALAIRVFSEEAARWELANPSSPNHSVARLRSLILSGVPQTGAAEADAAERIKSLLEQSVGLDFTTAFNLTAFLTYWWHARMDEDPHNPDAAAFDLRHWLNRSTIPTEQQRIFLHRVSMTTDDIVAAFDTFGGMSFHEMVPFRNRPLLRSESDQFAFICPQFATEKGGVDLLWLASSEQGIRAKRPWTDDFGILYERYVRLIFEGLGASLGGRYEPDIAWSEGDGGQIDGLIHAGHVLVVIEVKGSLLSQRVLAAGTVDDVKSDIERKFVRDGSSRKAVVQLLEAVAWLESQRKARRQVRGIDLSKVYRVVPLLVTAERALRFPPATLWLNHRMKLLKSEMRVKSPGALENLVICGTEDLENLEQLAIERKKSPISVLDQYVAMPRSEGEALWQHYAHLKSPHPRIRKVLDEWVGELRRSGVVPAAAPQPDSSDALG